MTDIAARIDTLLTKNLSKKGERRRSSNASERKRKKSKNEITKAKKLTRKKATGIRYSTRF